MTRSYSKRVLSIVLSVLVIMAFTVMTTVQVNAAAKKKTVYQVTQVVATDSYSKSVDKYTYNKNGLLTKYEGKSTYTDKSLGTDTEKNVFTRNGKGAITKGVSYESGKLVYDLKTTVNSKGQVTKALGYNVDENGAKTLHCTTTFTYYPNGNMKKIVDKYTSDHQVDTTYFRNNGTMSKQTTKGDTQKYTITYDKKGRIIKSVYSFKDIFNEGMIKGTKTYKYSKEDKHGNATKVTATDTSVNGDGEKFTETVTETTSYKYDKNGNITSDIVKHTKKSDGKTNTYTTKHTYKYKKYSVAAKYQKYIDNKDYDWFI